MIGVKKDMKMMLKRQRMLRIRMCLCNVSIIYTEADTGVFKKDINWVSKVFDAAYGSLYGRPQQKNVPLLLK